MDNLEEISNQNRDRSQAVAPMAHQRQIPMGTKGALGALGVGVSVGIALVGFLLTSYRDAQNQLATNFQSYAASNNQQHEKFWDEIQSIRLFLCTKFPNWRRCR